MQAELLSKKCVFAGGTCKSGHAFWDNFFFIQQYLLSKFRDSDSVLIVLQIFEGTQQWWSHLFWKIAMYKFRCWDFIHLIEFYFEKLLWMAAPEFTKKPIWKFPLIFLLSFIHFSHLCTLILSFCKMGSLITVVWKQKLPFLTTP